MKNALLAALIILTLLFGITWSALTGFGSRTGVYITQDVKRRSVLRDVYDVSTYVWNTNWSGLNHTIEYSEYATVSYCQLDSTKSTHQLNAKIARDKIKILLKSRLKDEPCP